MILSSAESTEATRRIRVRDLAGISMGAFNDAALDIKIKAADAIATALFGGNVPTEEGSARENFLTISNIKAAVLILQGISEKEGAQATITSLETLCKQIMDAVNGRAAEQHKPTVRRTAGVTAGARGFGQ